jgi:UDP-2,3-diacylglucosamine hydrolase
MHVFISDVHLSEPHSKRYGAFLRLLDKVRNDERITDLYLVGDIFDLWIGDRKLFQEMHAEALLKIRSAAIDKNVHYFEGNHDFQLGPMWKRMNVHVHPAEKFFKIDEQRFLISHGDQLDREDKPYLRLRWFFRTPVLKLFIKVMPQWVIFWIGSAMNTTEQKGKPSKAQENAFQAKWQNWTKALRKENDFDVFICGHHHFRADYKCENKDAKFRAINLGTWLDGECKALVYESQKFEFLKTEDI